MTKMRELQNPAGFGGRAGKIARDTRALFLERLRRTLSQVDRLGLYGDDVVEAAEQMLLLRKLRRSEVTQDDAVLAANALRAVIQNSTVTDTLAIRAGKILDNLSRQSFTTTQEF